MRRSCSAYSSVSIVRKILKGRGWVWPLSSASSRSTGVACGRTRSLTIEVARDGEEALDYLFCRGRHADRSFNHQPRLVLLDLKLPKVDGLDVLRAVKSDPRTKSIPVVILTASKEERDMVEGYKLGAN